MTAVDAFDSQILKNLKSDLLIFLFIVYSDVGWE